MLAYVVVLPGRSSVSVAASAVLTDAPEPSRFSAAMLPRRSVDTVILTVCNVPSAGSNWLTAALSFHPVVRSAKVRRAKLYYLRDLKGKAARMKDSAKA